MTTPARVAAAAVIGVLLVGGAYLYFDAWSDRPVGRPDRVRRRRRRLRQQRPPLASTHQPAGLDRVRPLRQGPRRLDSGRGRLPIRRSGWSMPTGPGSMRWRPASRRTASSTRTSHPTVARLHSTQREPRSSSWEAGIDGGAPQLLSAAAVAIRTSAWSVTPCTRPMAAHRVRPRRRGSRRTRARSAIRELATGAVTLIASTLTPFTSGELAQPSWSPDGSQIGYATARRPEADKVIDSQISVVRSMGRDRTGCSLPADTPWGDTDWSPDGSTDRPELVADP